MATHSAARRNPALVALLGGFILFAGLGATAPAAYADDDDWHSEASRPVEPAQQLKDRKAIQAIAVVKPQREQVYVPRSTLQPLPTERFEGSAYQTATVDRPNH